MSLLIFLLRGRTMGEMGMGETDAEDLKYGRDSRDLMLKVIFDNIRLEGMIELMWIFW